MEATHAAMRAVFLEQTARTSSSSKTQMKQLVEESDSKLTSLESEIAALQAQLNALIQLRNRERAAGVALRSLLAPIRTLPIELLAKIFLLTIREGQNSRLPNKNFHFEDAFRVSHVCSHWRLVANSTPRLWAGPVSVNLSYGYRMRGNRVSKHADVDGMKAWLERSAPLSIPVSFAGFGSGIPVIVEEVMRTAPRWRSLQLYHSTPPLFFKRLAEHALDNLEELALLKDAVNFSANNSTNVPFFGPTPRLRKLSLTPNVHVRMPWVQLTHLTIHDGRVPDISFEILAQCKSLVTASVRTFGWNGLPPTGTVISLDNLRTLVLDFYGPDGDAHFTPFLDSLCTPALEELTLDLTTSFIWIETQFTAFQLFSPNITHLQITTSGLTSHDLKAALFYAPSLTHLVLQYCPSCIDDSLLCAMQYKRGAEPLVPRLHDLILLGIHSSPEQETMLKIMIESRWNSESVAVTRWTSINLSTEHPFQFSRDFLAAMDALKCKGIPVKGFTSLA